MAARTVLGVNDPSENRFIPYALPENEGLNSFPYLVLIALCPLRSLRRKNLIQTKQMRKPEGEGWNISNDHEGNDESQDEGDR